MDEEYNSSDDEDYVPPPDDEPAKKPIFAVLARKAGKPKSKAKTRKIGADVLSDEDEALLFAPDVLFSSDAKLCSMAPAPDNDAARAAEVAQSKHADGLLMELLASSETKPTKPPASEVKKSAPSRANENKAKSKTKKVYNSWETKVTPKVASSPSDSLADIDVAASDLGSTGRSDSYLTKTEVSFAGQKIEVVEAIQIGSKEDKQREKKRKMDPLSKVLDGLKAPKACSTLEKTRLDWDHDKRIAGDQDLLSQFSKNGYLDKQKFLQDTDLRQFELEKNARAASRS